MSASARPQVVCVSLRRAFWLRFGFLFERCPRDNASGRPAGGGWRLDRQTRRIRVAASFPSYLAARPRS